MKQTANYQLNQWEQTDRIQMADFNADNSRVDQALAGLQAAVSAETAARQAAVSAEASARQSADTALQAQQSALQEKTSRQLLKSLSVTASCTSYDIPMSDIDWTQWKTIHVVIDAVTESGYSIFLSTNGTTSKSLGSGSGNSSGTIESNHKVAHYILLPQYEPRLNVCALNLAGGTMAMVDCRYSALSYLRLACSNTTYTILAGTTIQIWGEH